MAAAEERSISSTAAAAISSAVNVGFGLLEGVFLGVFFGVVFLGVVFLGVGVFFLGVETFLFVGVAGGVINPGLLASLGLTRDFSRVRVARRGAFGMDIFGKVLDTGALTSGAGRLARGFEGFFERSGATGVF